MYPCFKLFHLDKVSVCFFFYTIPAGQGRFILFSVASFVALLGQWMVIDVWQTGQELCPVWIVYHATPSDSVLCNTCFIVYDILNIAVVS